MSADNWTICPRCKKTHEAERDARIIEAAEKYGKVSADEWVKLNDLASKEEPLEESLREDYGIGIDSDGHFEVSYRCSCKCGFRFAYKFSQEAP